MLHLQRVVRLLDELLESEELERCAQEPGARALTQGAQHLRDTLVTETAEARLSEVLATLHRLRGHCDFDPLTEFAGLLDEAVTEATQIAMLR